jgi:hypothetical protein
MAVATTLSHLFYHATVVMLHMFALVAGTAFSGIWNATKLIAIVWSSLWESVAIPILPVAYQLASCLWMCMSYTVSVIYSVSGNVIYVSNTFAIPILWPVLRNLWMLLSYNWKVTLVVWFVWGALINLEDHMEEFDKSIARVISDHTALIHQRHRLAPEDQAAFDYDAEMIVPTGAYDYSQAYKLNGSDETNSEE